MGVRKSRAWGRAVVRSRSIVAVAVCLGMILGGAPPSPAEDAQTAVAALARSPDFRVRVSAALSLGKTRPAGARAMLERALDDGHPAVRTAAAAALESLGDPAAIPALQRHARGDVSGAARAQMSASASALARQGGAPPAPRGHARYVVAIGPMRNVSGVRGDALSAVLREAARTQAQALPGAVVLDAGDPAVSTARMPVLLLDGQVTRLAQTATNGAMRIEARVEFSIRRIPQQTLKGTLSGGASAVESVRALSDARLAELEDQIVDGAVESALRGANTGLSLAAK